MIPCVIFEDEHLLVVNKPAGMNTHAPSPFAGEGIYDWFKLREPRWSQLAIIHRLDKETSGVIVFGKTTLANRSLTEQFTGRAVKKTYLLLTDQSVPREQLTVVSTLVRAGEKYVSRPLKTGERAETRFRRIGPSGKFTLVEAEPVTGRTHQIRVHAAAEGFPVLGDTLYGGTIAPRVCLHAAELTLTHPETAQTMSFRAPADFETDGRLALRAALVDPEETNAFRLIHGAADAWPGWYVDRLGEFLLSQSERPLSEAQLGEHRRLLKLFGARGAYHKMLTRHVRRATVAETSPQLALGGTGSGPFVIRENGVNFELSFAEGYSTGLFLDQRDNRRRILTNHVAAEFPLFSSGAAGAEVLNTFAYTCGFSVCAAKAGARTTSVDLSKKYLAWGKRNFALNQLDAAKHDFIFGDVFDWLKRLAKQQRKFDLIILDPPTFSQSRDSGTFRAEKDFGRLVTAALPLLKTGGALFASSNAARWKPEDFLATVTSAVNSARRKVARQHYAPQPPDFPIHRDEPAYLKTVWMQIH